MKFQDIAFPIRVEIGLRPIIKLSKSDGLGLIISWPTGIRYTNQTGGTHCLGPQVEGTYVPLDTALHCRNPGAELCRHFSTEWCGDGALEGLLDSDADFIDDLLVKCGFQPKITVNRQRLEHSHEAWVFVDIAPAPTAVSPLFEGFQTTALHGVLTWPNSD